MRYAPILEYRNGLPFSMIDSSQAFVGEVNSTRFPFSLSGFNLTNHFNALDVHRNTADPESGVFFGNHQRRFRLDFDVIF